MLQFLRAPEIVIVVAADAFVFREGTREVRIPAVVGPDLADGLRGIELSRFTAPERPVALFDAAPSEQSRLILLTAWLRKALLQMLDTHTLKLRPHCEVHDAAMLNPMLSGYQYPLLRDALIDAGARTVRFVERPPAAPPRGFDRRTGPTM